MRKKKQSAKRGAAHTSPGIIAADEQSEVKQLKGVVKVVASDIGHVLVDFTWSDVIQSFCDRLNLTTPQFRKVLAHVGTLGFESGDIDTIGVVKEVNEQMSIICGARGDVAPLTVDEFHLSWCLGFHENEQVAEILDELARSYQLYALSNTNESHWQFLTESLKIERHFHDLILSYVVRSRKPDAGIYQELFKLAEVEPHECLFIDDLEENIEAARKLGMHAIHFVGVEDLKQQLSAMGCI
jgi:FMN phosphatase YigB (HAD superfamily)